MRNQTPSLTICFVLALTLLPASALEEGCRSEEAGATSSPSSETTNDFGGPVDIGGDRKLYLICRGTGKPTVILESGYHESSDAWITADAFPPAVLPGVAGFTRVCAYDRPGTARYTDPPQLTDRSNPAPMPRTAEQIGEDLHELLAAARVPAPYVLVGHSMGGLLARYYAQVHPDEVIGMVMVDAFPIEMPELLGAEWPAYRMLLDNTVPEFATNEQFERIDVEASIAEIKNAPPLRRMPLIVLSKTEPFAHPPNSAGFSFESLERSWPIGAAELIKLEPETPHIMVTGSDHYIQVNQPDIVIQSIRLVIERAGKLR
ncbi:MAG: alpha/beta fold hydrolase [Hyphomicrobiales bacterium]|nr:alpha/beta fold hydrolase [Hyphomicrobiales bacterium]